MWYSSMFQVLDIFRILWWYRRTHIIRVYEILVIIVFCLGMYDMLQFIFSFNNFLLYRIDFFLSTSIFSLNVILQFYTII